MPKSIYSEIKDCLDCPFARLKDRWGGGWCWHYNKSILAKSEYKPKWCYLKRIIVECFCTGPTKAADGLKEDSDE